MHHVDDVVETSIAAHDALHRSRARRRRLADRIAAVARRRRRRGSTAAGAVVLVVAAGAPLAIGHGTQRAARTAAATDAVLQRGDRGSAVRALQAKLGIGTDGVYGSATARAVRRFQRRSRLAVDGVAGPQTLRALGLAAAAPRQPAAQDVSASAPADLLQAIARCESGGDPTAVSADGRYRGKYQFRRATWRAMGGSGDPAAAPEAEQDRLAAKLLAAQGTRPWPVCGQRAQAAGA